MSTTALEVRIRSGKERVELARLQETLAQLRMALSEIDHVYYFRGSRPKWVVADLASQATELTVRVTAGEVRNRDTRSVLAPINALVSGVDHLQREPQVPEYYTERTVERLLNIGQPGRGIQEVALATVNGSPGPYVPVSEPVRTHARQAVQGAQTSLGSVAGWLDSMNARRLSKGLLVVGLYDPLTRRAVTGHLPAAMEDEAHARYWRKRVLARGEITRNQSGQVVRIKIDHLESLTDSDRASADELLGIAPDWLNGRDVDEYIEEARRA